MNKTAAVLLALGIAYTATVSAQPNPRTYPKPADFALRIPLEVSGRNGVVQFQLPPSVYRASRHPSLADLRVFRADGSTEPFHLRLPQPLRQIEQSRRETVLFPIWSEATAESAAQISLSISAGTDGAVRWTVPPPVQPAAKTKLSAIIVDLGASDPGESLSALLIAKPSDGSDYQATLMISRSDDLKLWDDVVQAKVGWFSSADGDQQLAGDRVSIGRGHGRYLKLRWRGGEATLFPQITALWRSSEVAEPARHEWVLEPSPGRYQTDVVYAASPAIAASSVRLQLAEVNSILPARLGRYRLNQARPPQWRFQPMIEANFYRLLRDGVERRSSDLSIRPLALEQWVLRTDSMPATPPKLVLSWQPHTLIFVAQGREHILAVGASAESLRTWRPGAAALDRVAPGYSPSDLETLEAAIASPVDFAESPVSPLPEAVEPDNPQNTQYWLLWATLGFGVLFLAVMCWRLFRQLDEPKDAS